MHRATLVFAAAAVLMLTLAGWGTPVLPFGPPQTRPGWPIYERFCLACHGVNGDGRGPAAPYLWPPPRAFNRGELKWRSTVAGQPPTRDDLRQTIALGAPGTSMPAFPTLTERQRDDVIDVVLGFAPIRTADADAAVDLGPPPPVDVLRGAELWRSKGCPACHGGGASGNGPASFALRTPPYDLTTTLHRPREPGAEAYRAAAAKSITTGVGVMPSFAGAIPPADIWALADHIVEIAGINHRDPGTRAIRPPAIAADRQAPILAGTWPGFGDRDEVAVFGAAIPPQGAAPPELAPAQASLAARQCARCHAKPYREWDGSIHRAAASPGLVAQTEYGMAADERAMCLRCHAPLAEQARDAELRADGVSCAGCHVRGWIRRGPPSVAATLLALPGYPAQALGLYERGDFCLPCHQLPPRTAVAGRPLLDTYREWLDGPYMRRGVQCQHCHMANREHEVKGIHDPSAVRQGLRLSGAATRDHGVVRAEVSLENIGAGHMLPTTTTPAIWLSIALLDARGRAIDGAADRKRIGRDVVFGPGDAAWHERADTRIPPGEASRFARGWAGGRIAEATTLRITVEVEPDEFYERFYAEQLATRLPPGQRALFEQAAARARGSHYLAEQRDVPIQ
ncbi:MAG TPA: c-type cytochrome [Kofleriaceae bacterium]